MSKSPSSSSSALPGFGITMGVTITYLTLIILLPLSTIIIKAAGLSWAETWAAVASPRALAAYRLSFGISILAALMNSVFGILLAWVLTRYSFPLRRFFDAMVDLPFALPTAVAGIALTQLYAPNGWIGSRLVTWGIQGAFSPFGVFVALTFVGLPFVVRSVQPVLQDLDEELEEAAAVMGASPFSIFFRVLLPPLLPAACTGFLLAFARGLGEYGSVVFISGNMPMRTEIVPLLIMSRLEQFDYAGASVLAITMLATSLLLMISLNVFQLSMTKRREGAV